MKRNPTDTRALPLPATGARSIVIMAAALFLWMVWSLSAADVAVRASLDPGQISLGRAAQLTIEISGAGSGKVALPTVENLEIGYLGQNTSWQMVNGLTSQKVFYFFQVVPHAEGMYVVPSFEVEAGGQKLATAPLSLRVGAGQPPPSLPPPPAGATGNSPVTPSGASNYANANNSNAASSSTAAASRSALPKPENLGSSVASVQLHTPATDMYVGQMVPVTIKLFVRGDRQVELFSIRVVGDAFTMNPLGKNFEQFQEVIDGVPYKIAVWNTSVTSVKTGDFPVTAEVDMRIAEQAKRQRPPGFDDPFFDSIFTQYRMVNKTVQSSAQTWKVQPLPGEGKPDTFAGAIGDFNLIVKATPDKVKVGEPINLEMIVEGKGSLDRINAPTLVSTDGVKTYPPSNKIVPSDDSGVSGKKIFTEAVIPLKTGPLPPVTFSFFNPELKQYVTKTVDVPRIVITEAPASTMASSAAVPSSTAGTSVAAAQTKTEADAKAHEPALVPIKVDLAPFVADFNPVFLNPLFVAVQGIPLVALLVGLFFARRRQRLENDPDYARAHETCLAVKQQLEAMSTAVSRNDTASFFTAARRAVQYRLAERWKLKAEDISFEAIRSRNPELADSVQSLFNVADEIAYSGEAKTDVSLAEWQKAIVALLSRLEKKV